MYVLRVAALNALALAAVQELQVQTTVLVQAQATAQAVQVRARVPMFILPVRASAVEIAQRLQCSLVSVDQELKN